MSNTSKKYYARPLKSLLFFLLSLLFTIALILMSLATITNRENSISILLISLLGVPLFGFGTLWFVWLILGYIARKPLLIIDQDGLIDNTDLLEYGKRIKWEEVTNSRIIAFTTRTRGHTNNQEFVCLQLKNPGKFAQSVSKWRRHFMRINGVMMKDDYIYITTAFLNTKPKELLKTIQELSSGKIESVDKSESVEVSAGIQDIPNILLTGQGNSVSYSNLDKNMPSQNGRADFK